MKRPQHAPTLPPPIAKAQTLYEAGKFRESLAQTEKAEKLLGRQAEIRYWQAAACLGLQDTIRAGQVIEQALEEFPNHTRLMALGGAIAMRNGKHAHARALLERCIELAPGQIHGWINYAALLASLREHAGARAAAQKALALDPGEPLAYAQYALALKEASEMDAAIVAQRKATALSPRDATIRADLLFLMLFDQATTAQDLLREAKMLGRQMSARLRPQPARPARQGAPIRLGLLSNDLLRHACAYFILPLLANLDRSRVEVVALSLNPVSDHVTDKIRLNANRFVPLAGMSREQLIDTVRAEQLDVLMDLGGHTGNSPLQHMAHGLAPVQMTWLGYPGSTGMEAIQYRITDWTGDPAGFEAHYTETLLRAPRAAYVYAPLVQDPLSVYAPGYRVRETPALRNGFVTFGSCNNLGKVTDRTLHLWSAVLARVPGSRLLVEAAELDKEGVRGPLLARMARAGIDPQRVDCIPRLGKNQYLTYHDIDIVLDTSPLTGGTTTCDALWMGVPVVTLAGNAYHARISATFLDALGLDGLICADKDAYVSAATTLAGDIGGLNALRLTIRQRFEQSPVADGAGFARWLEAELAALVDPQGLRGPAPPAQQDGMYFAGAWHGMGDIVLAIAGLLEAGRFGETRSLLENLCAKWSKHWVVPYVLAEMEYRGGNKEAAVDLLMESVGLRAYHLPLYRLLSARMDECGYDKAVLADFLRQQFGMSLDYLEQQAVPTVFDVLGIEVVPAAAQPPATTTAHVPA
ncbi:tetratricopeptide repeat protein [Cupriavidus sp. 30B13]|uniref:O-linked N-acetylglucosamine transferase, SPINDLY family protein n=1 Tax=Cupriavidus sp. 30B13 TaxID=3384241 RepID=UPI003B8F0899